VKFTRQFSLDETRICSFVLFTFSTPQSPSCRIISSYKELTVMAVFTGITPTLIPRVSPFATGEPCAFYRRNRSTTNASGNPNCTRTRRRVAPITHIYCDMLCCCEHGRSRFDRLTAL
jgi:hypothetical protein